MKVMLPWLSICKPNTVKPRYNKFQYYKEILDITNNLTFYKFLYTEHNAFRSSI